MHRLCASHGLSPIGSATLPEMFPQLLDPQRRALVLGAADAEMREVLLDLAIHQSFRRDLFAYGRRPLLAAEHRRRLEPVLLVQRCGDLAGFTEVPTSLGQMGLEPAFCGRLQQLLAAGPLPLAVVADELGEDLLALLPRLALLITAEALALALPAEADAVAAFNRQLLERITAGAPIDALLSPLLCQPVRLSAVEAFLLQAWEQGFGAEEVPQLAMLGMEMAGAVLRSPEGGAAGGSGAGLGAAAGAMAHVFRNPAAGAAAPGAEQPAWLRGRADRAQMTRIAPIPGSHDRRTRLPDP